MKRTRSGRPASRGLTRAHGRVALVLVIALATAACSAAGGAGDASSGAGRGRHRSEQRSLDGAGNNRSHRTWGQSGRPYRRVSDAVGYADGLGEMVGQPSPRAVSNRVFDDTAQNVFSEHGVTHWGFAWGQFVDHSIGLRATVPEHTGESVPIGFDAADPLERFRNDFGGVSFERTPAAPETGDDDPRQQINSLDSYLDASAVYGNDRARLEWLRDGPVNGDLRDNGAHLVLPDGQLPTVTARPGEGPAPAVEVNGRLEAMPDHAVVAGDTRANENIALQATQLLFAREHNRIVDALPDSLSETRKFDIARRVVAAEQQHITYTEFLPSLGVRLPRYRGYDDDVDATLSNEFATVGYRAHSMIHGELEPIGHVGELTDDEVEALEAGGVEVEIEEDEQAYVVPLGVASFNPDLVPAIGLEAIMRGLGGESQYRNDEMMDDQLRSVLFQVPMPGVADPQACLDGAEMPQCFHGVVDLGALDIQRGRDHGMPTYNDLREAYGLPRAESFTDVTGEDTDEFPDDSEIDAAAPLDDPDILDVVSLTDREGAAVEPGTEAADTTVTSIERRTTLAARLRALYGDDIESLDAFVGMMAEPHPEDSELGELQHAMWADEFTRLRDGDRFFYARDRELRTIRERYGIDHRRTLAEVIVDNTDVEADEIEDNVFRITETQTLDVRPSVGGDGGGDGGSGDGGGGGGHRPRR